VAGKEFSGEMPALVLKAIRDEGLDPERPFAQMGVQKITNDFKLAVRRLFEAGDIQDKYSPHDLASSLRHRVL